MTAHVMLRFYEELNDFLPTKQQKTDILVQFKQTGSVKDLIESLGVPHTEIDLILVNGVSVTFDYNYRAGDRISVYPMFETLDISPLTRLRPKPLRRSRFILDTHLGRLSAYLRMLGFDSEYKTDADDAILIDISVSQKRILLSRDRRLLMRKRLTHGYYVRNTQPRMQIWEVLTRFDLFNNQKPFSRCMKCNGKIHSVEKSTIDSHLPNRTKRYFQEFWQCAQCKKIYWKGSHFQRMQNMIKQLLVSQNENNR